MRQHHKAVGVAGQEVPGQEVDAAEMERDVPFAGSELRAFARIEAEAFDMERQSVECRGVANGTEHNDPRPAVGHG